MSNVFFDQPIPNSPYEYPGRHWELDANGQPTQRIIESRRKAEFITPIPKPKPKKVKSKKAQTEMHFEDMFGSPAERQKYDPTPIINELRRHKEWLDGYLECKGGAYPAQLMYQELTDRACEKITTGITRAFVGQLPIQALLDRL